MSNRLNIIIRIPSPHREIWWCDTGMFKVLTGLEPGFFPRRWYVGYSELVSIWRPAVPTGSQLHGVDLATGDSIGNIIGKYVIYEPIFSKDYETLRYILEVFQLRKRSKIA